LVPNAFKKDLVTIPPPPQQPPHGPLGYEQRAHSGGAGLRAAIVLWILAALGLLCGFSSLNVPVSNLDQMIDQVRAGMTKQQQDQLAGMDLAKAVRIVVTVVGVTAAVMSVIMIALGLYVKRGSRAGAIAALVICVPLAIWSLIVILVSVIQLMMGNVLALFNAVMWLLIGLGDGLGIYWLAQVVRSTGTRKRQQQAQYWQYQQQQQSFPSQGGYGYGYLPKPDACSQPPLQAGLMPPPPTEGPGDTPGTPSSA
jgi:hypothetical protein